MKIFSGLIPSKSFDDPDQWLTRIPGSRQEYKILLQSPTSRRAYVICHCPLFKVSGFPLTISTFSLTPNSKPHFLLIQSEPFILNVISNHNFSLTPLNSQISVFLPASKCQARALPHSLSLTSITPHFQAYVLHHILHWNFNLMLLRLQSQVKVLLHSLELYSYFTQSQVCLSFRNLKLATIIWQSYNIISSQFSTSQFSTLYKLNVSSSPRVFKNSLDLALSFTAWILPFTSQSGV